MTGASKLIYAIVAFFLIVVGVFAVIASSTSNCWDNYTTEDTAIMACEVHN